MAAAVISATHDAVTGYHFRIQERQCHLNGKECVCMVQPGVKPQISVQRPAKITAC